MTLSQPGPIARRLADVVEGELGSIELTDEAQSALQGLLVDAADSANTALAQGDVSESELNEAVEKLRDRLTGELRGVRPLDSPLTDTQVTALARGLCPLPPFCYGD